MYLNAKRASLTFFFKHTYRKGDVICPLWGHNLLNPYYPIAPPNAMSSGRDFEILRRLFGPKKVSVLPLSFLGIIDP